MFICEHLRNLRTRKRCPQMSQIHADTAKAACSLTPRSTEAIIAPANWHAPDPALQNGDDLPEASPWLEVKRLVRSPRCVVWQRI